MKIEGLMNNLFILMCFIFNYVFIMTFSELLPSLLPIAFITTFWIFFKIEFWDH